MLNMKNKVFHVERWNYELKLKIKEMESDLKRYQEQLGPLKPEQKKLTLNKRIQTNESDFP